MKYSAEILPGRGEGKRIGWPTLNFRIPENFTEKSGIYAGWIWFGGEKLMAAFHWGPIPAFGVPEPALEAHVLDMILDAPPAAADFELVKYLRPIRNFETKEDLSRQIEADVRAARAALSSSDS